MLGWIVAEDKTFSQDLEDLAREAELYANPLTEKQRDILAAAEKLFAEAGYAQTPTAAIAREAGVTERTLFKHFPSKQDLLKRVLFPLLLKTVLPVQLKHVQKILQSDGLGARELIGTLALDRWEAARVLGPRLRFVLAEFLQNEQTRQLISRLFEKYIWAELVTAVETLQKKRELRFDMPAPALARHILMSILGHGLLRGVIRPEAGFDDQKDLDVMLEALMDGIRSR